VFAVLLIPHEVVEQQLLLRLLPEAGMTAGTMQQSASSSSLHQLATQLRNTSKSAPNIATREFVDCCDTILPFFDHLGPVFHVARGEFQQKLETLKTQSSEKPLLVDIVEADRRANRATVRNSRSWSTLFYS
jgi:hypothetical protein